MTACAACGVDCATGGGVRDGRVLCPVCLRPPVQGDLFCDAPDAPVSVEWSQLTIGDTDG